MNRRKFLASLGIAPFAPALAKVVPPVVEEKFFWLDNPITLGRQTYVGPSIIEMLEESMMKTKQQMAANILQNYWSETDEGL